MPKSRETKSTKSAGQPARRVGRKSAKATKPRQPSLKTVSSRSPKVRSPAAPARSSKKAEIIALLERQDGAVISDLTKATGWQAHSVRAALTGLRKEGNELLRNKDAAGVTHYRLAMKA